MATTERLTVTYLLNGNVKQDKREGHNFRWRVLDGTLDISEYDDRNRFVWTKVYYDPVSAELDLIYDDQAAGTDLST